LSGWQICPLQQQRKEKEVKKKKNNNNKELTQRKGKTALISSSIA